MFSVGTLWVAKVCMSNQTTHIPSVTTSKVILSANFWNLGTDNSKWVILKVFILAFSLPNFQ